MDKNRNQCIDVLKGIGIFFVVFNHISFGKSFFIYIQSFHMPLFFLISGYLWKRVPFFEFIKKRSIALLTPYFIFILFFFFIDICLGLSPDKALNSKKSLFAIFFTPTDNTKMPIATAMWFLPCLLFSCILYWFADSFEFRIKVAIVTSVAVCGVVYSRLSEIMLPCALEPTTTALLFMLIGEWLRNNKLLEKPIILNYPLILLIVEALLAFVNGSVDMRSARYHIIPLYIINGTLGTIGYYGISKTIMRWKTRIGIVLRNELRVYGKYSIVVLCIHQFLIMIMEKALLGLMSQSAISELICKIVILFLTMLVCRIAIKGCEICRPMRKLFGIS